MSPIRFKHVLNLWVDRDIDMNTKDIWKTTIIFLKTAREEVFMLDSQKVLGVTDERNASASSGKMRGKTKLTQRGTWETANQ